MAPHIEVNFLGFEGSSLPVWWAAVQEFEQLHVSKMV